MTRKPPVNMTRWFGVRRSPRAGVVVFGPFFTYESAANNSAGCIILNAASREHAAFIAGKMGIDERR